MANVKNVFLSKLLQKRLDDSDTKFHIYLQTKWLDDAVELVLQDSSSNKCYKGRLANEEVRESASELEIPYHEFYEEIYGALTTNLSPEFFSDIKSEELAFKLIKRKDFDVTYVQVKLREVQGNHELLETAIELIEGMSQEKEKAKETQQNGQGQQASQDTVMQEEEKNKMLKKFAMLLNSKKAKIEELQLKLELLQSGEAAMRSDGSSNEGAEAEDLNVKASTSGGNKRARSGHRKAIISEDDDDDFSAMTQPMTQALV